MALDSTAKAIATQAWTQLLSSITSGEPPSDMSKYYFYRYEITDFNHFQHNLQRLQIHTYKLGTENIRAKMTSAMHSQVVPTNELENQQGVEHVRYGTRSGTSYEVVPTNEDENQQGIEHIRYSMKSGAPYEVVQENEDENQQGIEHIQYSMRSGSPYQVVLANGDETQQGIEHVQYSMRSRAPYQVVQANEDENQQGIEHVQYSMRSGAPYQVGQANEDENQQGIEHVQYCMRSGTPYNVVQENEDENQPVGIEQIGYVMSSTNIHEVVQASEHENLQGTEQIQSTIRSSETCKPEEYEDHKTTSYVGKSKKVTRMPEEYEEIVDRNKHRRAQATEILAYSTILELVKNECLLGEEQPIIEPDLLEMIENFHGLEANIIRMALEEEPDDMNQKYDDTEHMKKEKELLLRIFDTENCQQTMCKILRKSGRDCSEHYEAVEANEEGLQNEIKFIPYCIRPTVPFEVVRAIEHGNQQMLKWLLKRKYTRSTGLHKVLEETQFGFEQSIDYYEAKKLSTLFDELLELVEIGELHGNVEPKPETSVAVVGLMKLLYHYGLDTIQSGVEEELKEVNEKCEDVEKDPAMQCKKRLLEVMLRICSTKTCQRTIYQIIGKALRGQMWRFVDE